MVSATGAKSLPSSPFKGKQGQEYDHDDEHTGGHRYDHFASGDRNALMRARGPAGVSPRRGG